MVIFNQLQNSINACLDDLAQTTTNRVSIDSGCMPSCDDEFLEQFDQLQSISEDNLQSSSVRPITDDQNISHSNEESYM